VFGGLGFVSANTVRWEEVRRWPDRVELPEVAFLVTPTFTTRPSATLTRTRTPTRTRIPPTRTATPLPPTETPTLSPPTATWTPAPTSTPTPLFAAPTLLSPSDEVEFRGSGVDIELSWEDLGPLADDEWYALSLRYYTDGEMQYSGTWTKNASWLVPEELYMRAGQLERTFEWDVTVVQQTGTRPDGGREGVALGASSETRSFFWY
jgi:hypothetical protein